MGLLVLLEGGTFGTLCVFFLVCCVMYFVVYTNCRCHAAYLRLTWKALIRRTIAPRNLVPIIYIYADPPHVRRY